MFDFLILLVFLLESFQVVNNFQNNNFKTLFFELFKCVNQLKNKYKVVIIQVVFSFRKPENRKRTSSKPTETKTIIEKRIRR